MSKAEADLEQARQELLELLRKKAFERREVTLASGKKSNFYIDCKQVTLDATGHVLIGKLLLREVQRYTARTGRRVHGIGGLTLGADPMASAVSLTSALAGDPIPAFIVRKEPKKHGTEAYLEGLGNLPPGGEAVILEDVVTTGESAKKAVERSRASGLAVHLVLGLVDRLDGGREHLAASGVELVTLFDRRDFIEE